jgi:hypothetical protein
MEARIARQSRALNLFRQNLRLAKRSNTKHLGKVAICRLREITLRFGFSVAAGDLAYFDDSWYITHAGLVGLAARRRCAGIEVQQVLESSDQATGRWVFKATVYKSFTSRGFTGYGDADPSNVSTLMHGAEMRIAETRAVNRALRKAYGIGLCSVEELGSLSRDSGTTRNHEPSVAPPTQNGGSDGQPRLRDQLCLLIRKYDLNPTSVKAYAADFCGTQSLKGARRELVESFIKHLTLSAEENKDELLAKLNSYAELKEARS